LNRQGPDIGDQYRSAISTTPRNRSRREASKQALEASAVYKNRWSPRLLPPAEFYRAEDYHQQYLEKRGQSSCHI